MTHKKQKEIEQLINAKINVLLEGEKGSGKSTIIKNIAEKLKTNFYTIAMTKQTTLNALLGFLSINGVYIPSQLRKAVEEGGIMLLDEIDAGDPNVLLALNTLENGYLAFPDGIIKTHPDFRLCATSNPAGEHQMYTGRSKLDAATLDRFDIVWIDRDPKLEIRLTDRLTALELDIMRKVLSDNNVSKVLSMRDTIRYYKRKQIGLADGYEKTLLGEDSYVSSYNTELEKAKPKNPKLQIDCNATTELWEVLEAEGKPQPGAYNKVPGHTMGVDYIDDEGCIYGDGASEPKWVDVSTPAPKYTSAPELPPHFTYKFIKEVVADYVLDGVPLPKEIRVVHGARDGDPFGTSVSVFLSNGQQYKFNKEDL